MLARDLAARHTQPSNTISAPQYHAMIHFPIKAVGGLLVGRRLQHGPRIYRGNSQEALSAGPPRYALLALAPWARLMRQRQWRHRAVEVNGALPLTAVSGCRRCA
jgi:hypothetical protein